MSRDRFPRTKAQVTAGRAIEVLAEEHGLTDELRAHRVIVEWEAIVGPRIAAIAWPEGLNRGVLWVRVKNAPWLHELTLMRPELLRRLRAALGEDGELAGVETREEAGERRRVLVEDLRFHLRPRPTEDGDLIAKLKAAGLVRQPRPRRKAVPAVGEDKTQIENEAARVDDPELRELIRAVRVRNGR